MNRKALMPPDISRFIGSSGLSRAATNQLLSRIHVECPERHNVLKKFRASEDERFYWHTLVILDGGRRHLFTFSIDDVTSAEHLIIAGVSHDVK